MATFTVRPEGIIRQPALTMPGNATGSEAACTSLTASQIRTLLSLGTTSDVTFDIVRATTSVQTPLVNNASAALTLGNSTYGVTVPGAATFSGDISMSKTSAQGYIYAYNTTGTTYTRMSHDGVTGRIQSTQALELSCANGYAVTLSSPSGSVYAYSAGSQTTFRVLNSSGSSNTGLTHDGTDGIVTTSSGKLKLSPATTVQFTTGATFDSGLTTTSVASGTTLTLSCANGYAVTLSSPSGAVYAYNSGVQTTFRVLSSSGSSNIGLTHDGTNGILSTSAGNINIVPTGGTVAVTGIVTASAASVASIVCTNSVGANSRVNTVSQTRSHFTGTEDTSWVAYDGTAAAYLLIADSDGLTSVSGSVFLGGRTSSHVRIKRTASTTTAFRLGDDSADAPISCAGITASGVVSHGAYTVATLPAAGSNAGKMAQVTDSNVAASGNYGATVAAGGSNRVKVFSDGTNWVIA